MSKLSTKFHEVPNHINIIDSIHISLFVLPWAASMRIAVTVPKLANYSIFPTYM